MVIPNMWENKKCSKPPTRYQTWYQKGGNPRSLASAGCELVLLSARFVGSIVDLQSLFFSIPVFVGNECFGLGLCSTMSLLFAAFRRKQIFHLVMICCISEHTYVSCKLRSASWSTCVCILCMMLFVHHVWLFGGTRTILYLWSTVGIVHPVGCWSWILCMVFAPLQSKKQCRFNLFDGYM